MRKEEYDVWCENLDGEKYWDHQSKEFYFDFNDEQKRILQKAFDEGISASAVAYTDVTASCMRTCLEFIPRDYYLWKPWKNIYIVDVWKTAKIFKRAKQCRYVLNAMINKVNIYKEFSDVRELKEIELEIIYKCSVKGVNICSAVKKKYPIEVLEGVAERKIKFKEFLERLYRGYLSFREGW